MQGLTAWHGGRDAEAPPLVVLNVVVEDDAAQPATVADAATWRDAFGMDFTVLADEEGEWVETWGNVDDTRVWSQHSYTVMDETGRVTWREDGHTGDTLDAMVEAAEDAAEAAAARP